jgi:EmrB/QacA subfamily drug resistance transporter
MTVAVLATSMAFIDVTALNVALPALQVALDASAAELLWVVNAYGVPLTGLLLLAGALGDQRGRRRVFALGIGVFALASLLCGLAPSAAALVAARALQGAGSALMIPASLALIAASFPAERLGRAVGAWSACSVVAMAIGPVLGGALAERGLWRGVFFLNLPLALVALALVARVPESRAPAAVSPPNEAAPPALDLAGAVLALAALASLSYACIAGPARGLGAPPVAGVLAAGLVALLVFLRVEARSAHPLLPLGLFRSREFAVANALTLLLYTAFHGMMLFVPLNLVQVQGYGALEAGLAQLPVLLLLVLFSPLAGRIVDRRGPRLPLVAGTALACLGFVAFHASGLSAGPSDYAARFLPAFLGLGAGLGLCMAPLSTMVLTSVGRGRFALASGVNSTLSRLAGVLAVALFGALAQGSFRRALEAESRALSSSARAALQAQAGRLAAAELPTSSDVAEREAVERAIARSFVTAFADVSLLGAGLSGAGTLLALLALPRRLAH